MLISTDDEDIILSLSLYSSTESECRYISIYIYYCRPPPSESDVDADGMKQRFVEEYRTYEDALFTVRERDYFHRSRGDHDTLGHLYFRVVEWICTTVVGCMTRFHTLEKKWMTTLTSAATAASKQKVPLFAVHALYKMKEYYVPLYDAVSYDVELLCIACRLRPVYRPCTRLAKKVCCQRFNSRCLQCFIEYELTAGGREHVLDVFRLSTVELQCRCHRNYLSLLFPSFMLFASESSIKMVLRVCVLRTMADMLANEGDRSAMTKRIDSRIAGFRSSVACSGGGASCTVEKKQYVDRHYLYQLVSEYATDHFMICGGVCSELRSILRISGISNKMNELVNILSMVVGNSSLITSPSRDVCRETEYVQNEHVVHVADDGENFIGRLRYRLRMMLCSIHSPPMKDHYSFCPSCHIKLSTIVTILPDICKPDSMYDISRRQGIYNTDVTRRQAEKTKQQQEQHRRI